nr:MAG TPA: hypothetical protein [Caudoviricetes sp.]
MLYIISSCQKWVSIIYYNSEPEIRGLEMSVCFTIYFF